MRLLLFVMLFLGACAPDGYPAQAQVRVDPAVPVIDTRDETPTTFPKSRAKFTNDNPEFIDALAYVNWLVNSAMVYEFDHVQYGIAEKWVTMPDSGKGDCEDYALTKMEVLRRHNFPVISHGRIRTLFVKVGDTYSGHAVLEILLPSGDIAIFDNNFMELMTRAELEQRHNYVFYDW
jgi:predicted transglutaminase-like cysteine proteinase